jgi:uncharacterized phage protein (TIGR02216 family)
MSPEQFWNLTPREFRAALAVLAPAAVTPPDRAALTALIDRYPDTRSDAHGERQ